MSPDISTLCAGPFDLETLDGRFHRVVEAQFIKSTMGLVDSTEEQYLLEDIVEEVKPSMPEDLAVRIKDLHWLLWTPFRYQPPLKGGSRFGTLYDPPVWYASKRIETSLAEVAYSTLVLLEGSADPGLVIDRSCTAFQAHVKTGRAVALTGPRFSEFDAEIASPSSHVVGQRLGAALRKVAEAVVFRSARCPLKGHNVALFVPAFGSSEVFNETGWSMHATRDAVDFRQNFSRSPVGHSFPRSRFETNGHLPQPAMAG